MQQTIGMITSYITHALFRVRPTERHIEQLTLADLENIARYDGTLPYNDKRVRALVWEVKYYAHGKAAKLCGEYLATVVLSEAAGSIGKPLLIPMPMHTKRRRERGHNQTEVLCEAMLPHLKDAVDYTPHLLKRVQHTLPQQGLERQARLENVKNTMEVPLGSGIRGRVCIIVDDVTTTGASFAEAKRALKSAGVSEVHCVALAQS